MKHFRKIHLKMYLHAYVFKLKFILFILYMILHLIFKKGAYNSAVDNEICVVVKLSK